MTYERTPRLIFAIVTTVLQEAVIAAIVLWGLPEFDIYIPLAVLVVIMVAWALNAVTFFWIGSRALRRKPVSGLGSLIGDKGKVIRTLAPDGVVKIGDELWEARAAGGRIEPGEEVTVIEQDGLKLIVVKKQ